MSLNNTINTISHKITNRKEKVILSVDINFNKDKYVPCGYTVYFPYKNKDNPLSICEYLIDYVINPTKYEDDCNIFHFNTSNLFSDEFDEGVDYNVIYSINKYGLSYECIDYVYNHMCENYDNKNYEGVVIMLMTLFKHPFSPLIFTRAVGIYNRHNINKSTVAIKNLEPLTHPKYEYDEYCNFKTIVSKQIITLSSSNKDEYLQKCNLMKQVVSYFSN